MSGFTKITKGGKTYYEMSKSDGMEIRRVLATLWETTTNRDTVYIITPNGTFTLKELNRYLHG